MSDEAGLQRTMEFERLFNFLQEPIFVLSRDGSIRKANASGMSFLGGDSPTALVDAVEDRAALLRLLDVAAGVAMPVPGALVLRRADGSSRRVPVRAAVFLPGSPDAALLLRVLPAQDNQFLTLTRKVRELDAEIREHRRTEAALARALDASRAMLNELHHRVRNTTQMLLGMLAGARRNAAEPAVLALLAMLRRRLLAIGAAQQILYSADRMDAVPLRPLVENLTGSLLENTPGVQLALSLEDRDVPSDLAVPLSIILAELAVAGAAGISARGSGTLALAIRSNGDAVEIAVSCSGDGLPDWDRVSDRRTVDGLVQQIGGTLAPLADGFVLRFPDQARGMVSP
ncbi:histidine kinase dimerization/phosphoacceptor domain -containing protein [Faunimonas sp. B44]|uniref:histidine kinase dimerization/phosphoacceptor domain -containing protein n=1 Tax=Faunimonas sp. B44 TaxID=3461493 RepID=UPI00404458B0